MPIEIEDERGEADEPVDPEADEELDEECWCCGEEIDEEGECPNACCEEDCPDCESEEVCCVCLEEDGEESEDTDE